MPALLGAARAAATQQQQEAGAEAAAPTDEQARALLPSLRALRLLMQAPACREQLLADGGAELLQQLLRGCCGCLQQLGGSQGAGRAACYQLAAATSVLAEAAAWQDEAAKCRRACEAVDSGCMLSADPSGWLAAAT